MHVPAAAMSAMIVQSLDMLGRNISHVILANYWQMLLSVKIPDIEGRSDKWDAMSNAIEHCYSPNLVILEHRLPPREQLSGVKFQTGKTKLIQCMSRKITPLSARMTYSVSLMQASPKVSCQSFGKDSAKKYSSSIFIACIWPIFSLLFSYLRLYCTEVALQTTPPKIMGAILSILTPCSCVQVP